MNYLELLALDHFPLIEPDDDLASIIFDLPHPFGPTTADISEGKGILVGSTKDLKPERLICLSLIYLKKSLYILSNLLPELYVLFSLQRISVVLRLSSFRP